jgi:HEAT repeat protein
MCRFLVYSSFLFLALTPHAGAEPVGGSEFYQPPPAPLGVLVARSKAIRVLEVADVGAEVVKFKTTATLKGQDQAVPFDSLRIGMNKFASARFHKGEPVLWFYQGETGKDDASVALLSVADSWALGVRCKDEPEWFFLFDNEGDSITYEGTTTALRGHVSTILAGRETTITARAPMTWDAVGSERLWRIKAGPRITHFAVSDDSPHFVGWGSGEPDEVPKLMRSLTSSDNLVRADAAEDLGHLGRTARPAVSALRQALDDPDRGVRGAAARALILLGHSDEVVDSVKVRLRASDEGSRGDGLSLMIEIGPAGRPLFADLFPLVSDRSKVVRASVAEALGKVAADDLEKRKAVGSLVALRKFEEEFELVSPAIRSLVHLGPHAWEAMPTLRRGLENGREGITVILWLGRLDPPPVDLLAELGTNERIDSPIRDLALDRLEQLGPRARSGQPALRRMLRSNKDADVRIRIARILLAIDPEGSPPVVVPVLRELARDKDTSGIWDDPLSLLARCNAPDHRIARERLLALDPKDPLVPVRARDLALQVNPGDRDLVPTVRLLLSKKGYELDLAKALWHLGEREHALALAVRCLNEKPGPQRLLALRWLGQCGRDAKSVVPALQKALAGANGSEWARISLALWRILSDKGDGRQTQVRATLEDLLVVESNNIFEVRLVPGYFGMGPIFQGEEEAVGDAVAAVLKQLPADGDPAEALAKSLRDPSPHVRLVATLALARVEPRHHRLMPVLHRLLERQPHFFCFAADTLCALGPTAAPLAPLLVPLLRHPDFRVHGAAERVLHRIDPMAVAQNWGAVGVGGAVPADLNSLWDDLAAEDVWTADLAGWRLAGAGPKAVTLLRQRLRPPTVLSPQRVERLIADLDSDVFDIRQRASAELAGASEAIPALRRTLDSDPPLETQRRIEELLIQLDTKQSPEERRRLCAVRILESVGCPEARNLLRSLSQGDPRLTLTQEAAAALGRLERP